MALSAGTRLGPYEVLSPMGAGGMGEVYRARDPRLGRDVAIKALPSAFSADADRLNRFEQEARAAAASNHPNILAVLDVGQHDGAPYIVSELLDGETLGERLRTGRLPVRKATEYAVQIARGLAAAHEKGIVHRDLKPANIFITADGRVKILDFGLAKLTQVESIVSGMSAQPTTLPSTEPGMVLGTIGYMSPEQVRGLQVDHRSDIFALGAVLFEMLSGVRAFRGDTAADTMSAILNDDPRDLPIADRHIPPALARIVDRCLEKSPAARFQSASDLGFALESVSSHSDETTAAAAPRAGAMGNRLAWALFGVALVAAIALGALATIGRTGSEAPTLTSTILPPPDTAITDRGGSVGRRLALSPDGQRLAFTAAGRDRIIWLWVRRLDSLSAQKLEGTEGAVYPFWSPDSRFVGFFSEDGRSRSKLMKIDTAGGPPITVCELPTTNSTGGSWNRDGVIVFGMFGVPEGRIHRVPAAGGTPSPVTTLDSDRGETRHWTPSFLQDGRRFLYLASGVKGGNPFEPNGVYAGSLDSDDRTLVMPGGSMAKFANGHLLFLRGSTLMAQPFDLASLDLRDQAVPVAEQVAIGGPTGAAGAFSVSDNGRLAYLTDTPPLTQLTWFDRTGKQLRVIGEPASQGDLSLSPDGSRAAVRIDDLATQTGDVWVYDVARGVRTRLNVSMRFGSRAVWSSDGQRVVFSSSPKDSSNQDLYTKLANGAGTEELLLAGDQSETPMSSSTDGQFLAYQTVSSEDLGRGVPVSPDLWVLPLFGDRKPIPFQQTRFAESGARFSPDGRWIAYVSNESNRSEVYVAPFPGPGGKTLVSSAGGAQARWRRDGAELFYVAPGGRLMVAAVKGQAATFEVGPVQPLFQIRPWVEGGYLEVSADGQSFLVNRLVEENSPSPITLVVNWPAMLKK